jgi:hypothetical protein
MRRRILLITLMRIRILPFTLMRMRIRILASKNAQNLEKVFKQAHIPYILACQLQIDGDPDPAYHFDTDLNTDPRPAYHFDADADPDPTFQFDADPCGWIQNTASNKLC